MNPGRKRNLNNYILINQNISITKKLKYTELYKASDSLPINGSLHIMSVDIKKMVKPIKGQNTMRAFD